MFVSLYIVLRLTPNCKGVVGISRWVVGSSLYNEGPSLMAELVFL